jgi:molecular chaperone GrpE
MIDNGTDTHNQNIELEKENSTQELKQMLEQAANEWKQKYLYLNADFENFRRRSLKEYETMRIDVYARCLRPLLEIMDDFQRALAAVTHDQDRQGFTLIAKSIEKILKEAGVTEMDVESTFDPEKHEALLHVHSPEHQAGQIVSVLQKGYMFNGMVLRPAKVSVAQ